MKKYKLFARVVNLSYNYWNHLKAKNVTTYLQEKFQRQNKAKKKE